MPTISLFPEKLKSVFFGPHDFLNLALLADGRLGSPFVVGVTVPDGGAEDPTALLEKLGVDDDAETD